MKKLIYLLLLPLALAVVACGGKNGSSNKESVLARQDSVDAHGLQRMQVQKLKLILSLREETIIRWFRVLLTKVCLTSPMIWGIRM